MSTQTLDVRIEWHAPDLMFAAGLLRDGKPWSLDGALVGMGGTPVSALADLIGIARYLIIHGENMLTDGPVPLAAREWLFRLLDTGHDGHDEMYQAIREARAQEGE